MGGEHDPNRRYSSVHSYKGPRKATEILPGLVFWNNQAEGWSFNVIIDGITVRSNNRYPRHHIAKEAMRLEIDSIRKMLAKTAAIVAAEIAEHHHLSGDDDNRRFAVGKGDNVFPPKRMRPDGSYF